jgi:GTP-binding protein YchF
VIRCFENKDIVNVLGDVDPRKDVEVITTELILADMDQADKIKEKHQGAARAGNEESKKIFELVDGITKKLSDGIPVRRQGLPAAAIRDFNFLTAKPVLYVANVDEKDCSANVEKVRQWAKENDAEMVELNAKLEADVMALPPEERASFREALGIKTSGLDALAKAGQRLLKLITFFAAGPKEVHAWHVAAGAPIPQAAGKIHSDLERGFIRAEVYSVSDILEAGTEVALKAKGKMRMEGKDYLTQDGDVLHIHFKV